MSCLKLNETNSNREENRGGKERNREEERIRFWIRIEPETSCSLRDRSATEFIGKLDTFFSNLNR